MKNFYSVLLLALASVVTGSVNYFYHPLMIRFLTTGEFAEFESLVGTLNILGVLTSGIGLFLVKEIAKNSKDLDAVKSVFRYSHKILFATGCLAYLVFAACSPAIARFLKFDSVLPVLFVGTAILVSFQGTVVSAVLQGLGKFKFIAASTVASSVLRLLFGFSFVYFGYGLMGAVGGFITTSVLMFWLSFLFVWNTLKSYRATSSPESLRKDFRKEFGHAFHFFLLSLFLAVLMNLDVIFANNLFDSETAWAYAGLSVLAKFLIFLGGSIETVYYPILMGYAKNTVPRHFVVNSFGLLLLLGTSALAFNFFFGSFVLELMKPGLGQYLRTFLALLAFGGFYGFVNLYAKVLIGWKAYYVNYAFGTVLVALVLVLSTWKSADMETFVFLFIGAAFVLAGVCVAGVGHAVWKNRSSTIPKEGSHPLPTPGLPDFR